MNNLTTEITKLKEQKASSQKLQSEAQSKAESLGLQVKDLMADSSKLREEVASLQAAARNQKAAESQKDLAEDWTGVVEVRKTNSYLETKVEELEKYLERANNRPNVGGGAAVRRKK